ADPSCIDMKRYQKAFVQTIPPGRDPVIVSLADLGNEERPACFMLRVKKGRPHRWHMALRPGEDLRKLKADQSFGYRVDGGTGCVGDAEVDRASLKRTNGTQDVYRGRLLA